MTQTLSPPHAAAAWGWLPVRTGSQPLVEQLVEHFGGRIRNHGLRAGMRLPSVRALAGQAGVSRDTVVQAYDRLAAQGLVQSRRGAGFFVCAQRAVPVAAPAPAATLAQGAAFDTAYLLRGIFPVVATISRDGFNRIGDDVLRQRYEQMFAELEGERGGVETGGVSGGPDGHGS